MSSVCSLNSVVTLLPTERWWVAKSHHSKCSNNSCSLGLNRRLLKLASWGGNRRWFVKTPNILLSSLIRIPFGWRSCCSLRGIQQKTNWVFPRKMGAPASPGGQRDTGRIKGQLGEKSGKARNWRTSQPSLLRVYCEEGRKIQKKENRVLTEKELFID